MYRMILESQKTRVVLFKLSVGAMTVKEIDTLSEALQAQTASEQDATCISELSALSVEQFQAKRNEMPSSLRHAGIVFTEQLFNIKPLQIPLEAIKLVLDSHPSQQDASLFMKMLQHVISDSKMCTFVSEQDEFALPKQIFFIALHGVAVCYLSNLVCFVCCLIFLYCCSFVFARLVIDSLSQLELCDF